MIQSNAPDDGKLPGLVMKSRNGIPVLECVLERFEILWRTFPKFFKPKASIYFVNWQINVFKHRTPSVITWLSNHSKACWPIAMRPCINPFVGASPQRVDNSAIHFSFDKQILKFFTHLFADEMSPSLVNVSLFASLSWKNANVEKTSFERFCNTNIVKL